MSHSWKQFSIAFAGGVLVTGVILLILLPPRGKPVELLPAPTESPIAVYISGEVKNPDLYELAPGSRVADLVEAADGFSNDADQEVVNLAARLKDGMQVDVPAVGEKPLVTIPEIGFVSEDEKININTATVDQLVELPGIGNTKAAAIVNFRSENGEFKTIIEIMNVPGIGSGIYDQIMNLISVE